MRCGVVWPGLSRRRFGIVISRLVNVAPVALEEMYPRPESPELQIRNVEVFDAEGAVITGTCFPSIKLTFFVVLIS